MSTKGNWVIDSYLLSKGKDGPAKDALFTNLPFIRGLFSAFNFRTSYLIFFENSLVRLFSLYLDTLASLPPSVIAGFPIVPPKFP